MAWNKGAAVAQPRLTWGFLALLAASLFFTPVLAQTFPALTGRVVDQANILKPEERAALDAKLKAYEDKTSDQVVVATVSSLEGTSVEDYANRLFRAWQLGQKKNNNGVLLLVAPNDRKLRIEVGYGLEGALTDALSKVIITTAIAPQFQKGNFVGGIDAGVDAILSILTGDAEQWQRKAEVREDPSSNMDAVITFLIIAFVIFQVYRGLRGGGSGVRSQRGSSPWIISTGSGSGRSSGWSSGRSSGGGFSGGGGSSGGGGASGSW
ncbi:TPM domain-containing protein [Microvirga solisilvae]|uniref:TPM domain-containing protein n=1 Tax=Microvirga solisilvae TaxID=2919498 RepID=UPI001FAF1542|nr:TPM domain-containing protein [Microvirga solisilvae]